MNDRPPLMVISDSNQATLAMKDIFQACVDAGVRWFSLREKNWSAEQKRAFITWAMPRMSRVDGILSIHGDIKLAMELDLPAMHLPSNSRADLVRRKTGLSEKGKKMLIGASAHNLLEARSAFNGGASYVILGPVVGSGPDGGQGAGIGLTGLGQAVSKLPGPVIAIGGITADNVKNVMACGAKGIALMGSVMRAKDPGQMVSDILDRLS